MLSGVTDALTLPLAVVTLVAELPRPALAATAGICSVFCPSPINATNPPL
jgi:hypothetical protein